MNAIPVYCLDKNVADILAAMVTFDAGEIKLLILKLPLQWLVRRTPNVMARCHAWYALHTMTYTIRNIEGDD